MAITRGESFACDFPEWRRLLDACEEYAKLRGWRFVESDFMNLAERHEVAELVAARERAMPVALEYGDRVRACTTACAEGAEPPRLVAEFEACQRLVSAEAVYNSMLATVAAVGLGEPLEAGDGGDDDAAGAAAGAPAPGGGGDDDEADALSYQDMSQPVEVIARRLCAYDARLRAAADVWQERRRRLLHASFVVEFGLEYGLREMRAATGQSKPLLLVHEANVKRGGDTLEALMAECPSRIKARPHPNCCLPAAGCLTALLVAIDSCRLTASTLGLSLQARTEASADEVARTDLVHTA